MTVVIGALVIAVVIVFALPIALLMSGSVGGAAFGQLLGHNAGATHPGGELIGTYV